jgi:hypothetical protein
MGDRKCLCLALDLVVLVLDGCLDCGDADR